MRDWLDAFDAALHEQSSLLEVTGPRPQHSFTSCSPDQKRSLAGAVERAVAVLAAAEKYVADVHGRPDKAAPAAKALLLKHFRTTERKYLSRILTRLMRMRRTLEGGVAFRCAPHCTATPMVAGYANASQLFGGRGPIHVCFDARAGHADFRQTAADEQVVLIIHEAAHRYLGIGDHAYVWQPNYARLSRSDALDNADSYAHFCLEINKASPGFRQ